MRSIRLLLWLWLGWLGLCAGPVMAQAPVRSYDSIVESGVLKVMLYQGFAPYSFQQDGQPRGETLRLFIECSTRCMAYEIAAQELCDVVIETKIGGEGWSMGELLGLADDESAALWQDLRLGYT